VLLFTLLSNQSQSIVEAYYEQVNSVVKAGQPLRGPRPLLNISNIGKKTLFCKRAFYFSHLVWAVLKA
jgi:hypothetical protein